MSSLVKSFEMPSFGVYDNLRYWLHDISLCQSLLITHKERGDSIHCRCLEVFPVCLFSKSPFFQNEVWIYMSEVVYYASSRWLQLKDTRGDGKIKEQERSNWYFWEISGNDVDDTWFFSTGFSVSFTRCCYKRQSWHHRISIGKYCRYQSAWCKCEAR